MFKKSIDSVLKRAQGIVTDLNAIAEECDLESDKVAEKENNLKYKRIALRDTSNRAKALAQKWSELV